MKIAISTRGLFQGSFAISTIIKNLTNSIINLTKNKHQIYLYFNNPEFEKTFSHNTINRSKSIKNRFIWDHFWLPNAIKKDNIDYALFIKGTIPPLVSCKTGVLFHDLGYFDKELRPYKSLETSYMKLFMTLAAHKSQHLFSVSEFTKNQIINKFNINSEKVIVAYNNCSPLYNLNYNSKKSNSIKSKYKLPEKYIFWPTSISPRKNIVRGLDAYKRIISKIPHHLVITGGKSWKSNPELLRIDMDISNRVHLLGNIEEEDMPLLYANASFTIYPSLLEGFGIPILEAFNCGSPLITSNISSMPEIAGNAALLVDPYNVDQISSAILKLGTNASTRKDLIIKGHNRAKYFSWDTTAKIIIDQIEKL